MIMVTSQAEAGDRLAGTGLACPDCGARLAAWGYARQRTVTGLQGLVRVRPRRSRCTGCRRTHVVLPAELLPRRSVSVDLIGAVLLAAASGTGHRRIAVDRGLAAGTVRNWLRRFRANAEDLRCAATGMFIDLDPEPHPLLPVPEPSPLGNAVEALGAFAAAATRRFGPFVSHWQRICLFTRGRLLAKTYSYG